MEREKAKEEKKLIDILCKLHKKEKALTIKKRKLNEKALNLKLLLFHLNKINKT